MSYENYDDYGGDGKVKRAIIYDGEPIAKLPWYAKLEGFGSNRHSPVQTICWGCYGIFGILCCTTLLVLVFLIFILPVINGAI